MKIWGRADRYETDMRVITYKRVLVEWEYKVLAAKSVTLSGGKVPTSSLTLSIFIRNKKMYREDSRKMRGALSVKVGFSNEGAGEVSYFHSNKLWHL